MSNNEYEQQQFWKDKFKLLSQHLLEDLLIWGECAYKISDQGIERLEPNTYIVNERKKYSDLYDELMNKTLRKLDNGK